MGGQTPADEQQRRNPASVNGVDAIQPTGRNDPAIPEKYRAVRFSGVGRGEFLGKRQTYASRWTMITLTVGFPDGRTTG